MQLSPVCRPLCWQLSELEVNGQIEQVCEQVYSELQSQAMEAAMDSLDTMDTLPMPGCFRMRSHSYVRAIDQGCASEEEGEGGRPLLLLPSSPPRTSATTVRTIQSSTGALAFPPTATGGTIVDQTLSFIDAGDSQSQLISIFIEKNNLPLNSSVFESGVLLQPQYGIKQI